MSFYEGPSWEDAEREVLRWGVTDSQRAVRIASYSGVNPIYVIACVDYFRDHRDQFKPMDLFWRITRSASFRDPDDPETWKARK